MSAMISEVEGYKVGRDQIPCMAVLRSLMRIVTLRSLEPDFQLLRTLRMLKAYRQACYKPRGGHLMNIMGEVDCLAEVNQILKGRMN